MSTSRYALQRLLQMVPILLGISTVVFFMVQLIPGDPAEVFLGPQARPEQVEALRADLGLDRPLSAQYGNYLAGLARGDLGTSLRYDEPASSVVVGRLAPTLWLVGYGAVLTVLISVPLAAIAARRPGRSVDGAVRGVAMLGLGMPSFWVGMMLILGLGLGRGWFPISGFGEGAVEHIHHLFLPALTVALSMSPITIRALRMAMVEVLDSDHLLAARAKGLGRTRLLLAYQLRNAVVPAVTVLGVNLGWLVGNTVVIEQLFILPGLGSGMLEAISNRDFPLVQAFAMVFAFLVMAIALATDVLRAGLDPRVELS